jgi:hypothetical protein
MNDQEIAELNNYLCEYLREHIPVLKTHTSLDIFIASATMNFMLTHGLAKEHGNHHE